MADDNTFEFEWLQNRHNQTNMNLGQLHQNHSST